MNKLQEREAFCYLEKDIANADHKFLKTVPKPDPFFPVGSLIPGTGCFFPGTNILVPGTGVFRQKKTGFVTVATAFYLTEKGTYRVGSLLRHFPQDVLIKHIVPIHTTKAWNEKLISHKTNEKTEHDIFQTYTSDPNAKSTRAFKRHLKRTVGKDKYERLQQNRRRIKKNQLQKSAIRRIKQTLEDSERYVFSTFTQEQYAQKNLPRINKEAVKRANKRLEKVKDKTTVYFKKHKQELIDNINAKLVVKYKKSIKNNIVNESLAIAFATSTEVVEEIRKNRTKVRAMIKSNLLWQRGRRRRPPTRKPYTELVPTTQLLGRGLQAKTVMKRVVVENPYGSYGRSGDPVAVKVQTIASS